MRFDIATSHRDDLVDVTALVERVVAENGPARGAALVFCPHTTAAVTVNENADRDVASDLIDGLARIAPRDAGWRHREGNSDAHLKSSLVGSSVAVPMEGGRLALGTWQGIYFCEFDGPRSRHLVVTLLQGA
jgi:secondary thiamine-phosphate synthase enzyme